MSRSFGASAQCIVRPIPWRSQVSPIALCADDGEPRGVPAAIQTCMRSLHDPWYCLCAVKADSRDMLATSRSRGSTMPVDALVSSTLTSLPCKMSAIDSGWVLWQTNKTRPDTHLIHSPRHVMEAASMCQHRLETACCTALQHLRDR
jgi:hypothetical protein